MQQGFDLKLPEVAHELLVTQRGCSASPIGEGVRKVPAVTATPLRPGPPLAAQFRNPLEWNRKRRYSNAPLK